MELERKITRIGKSYGVTIPLDLLKELDIDLGDMVQLTNEDGKILLRKSRRVTLPEGISPDFFDVLKETTEKYDETLKGLVDR